MLKTGAPLYLIMGSRRALRTAAITAVLAFAICGGKVVARADDQVTNTDATQPASRVVVDSYSSQAMAEERTFIVYLPPSYDGTTDRRFPVLYLLHGDDGGVDSWRSLGIQAKMDAAIAAGAPEMIVVMPDGSGHYNDETDWANRWDGTDRIEDQVLEVIATVDNRYRTTADRTARYIGGFSAGGFGALNIALHQTELFSTVMSFSGFGEANDPEADPGVFGSSANYVAENSPTTLVHTQPGAGDLYYVLSAGQQDSYFQQRMAEFNAELDQLGFAHEFHIVPGGHDGGAWNAGLDFGLAYLTQSQDPGPDLSRQRE